MLLLSGRDQLYDGGVPVRTKDYRGHHRITDFLENEVALIDSESRREGWQPMGESLAGKGTLLVVDDDPAILRFLSTLLADDLCVLTAESGEQALERSRTFSGPIDLLLTDITMRNMNGMDLATQIAAQRPEIGVVLMSGFNAGELFLPNQGWHFILKPFKPLELIALVNSIISSRKSKSTAA